MHLCRVTGTVTATRKDERLASAKLLIVQDIDLAGKQTSDPGSLALDARFNAGIGDVVLVAHEGAVAAQVMGGSAVPTNVVIVGVVDDWDVDSGVR